MKKTIKLFGFIALAALIGLSMATLSLTSCEELFTYEVTVNEGTGSGSYSVGDTVTITAKKQSTGQQFVKWTVNSGGVSLDNVYSQSTTFTMPAKEVTITANFSGSANASTDESLNGAWIRVSEQGSTTSVGTVDTIIDTDGYFTKVDGGWESVMNKGNIKIGDSHFRNITKTGERTWSYQNRLYNANTFELLNWADGTITLSSDGQSFTTNVPESSSQNTTYNRVQNNNNPLDGAWIRVSEQGSTTSVGTVDTIIGSYGYFTKVDGGWESVMNKGNIKIGDSHFRNITKTGERTWSYQNQLYDASTFALLQWADGTITLSADGNSFTTNVPASSSQNTTYNRLK